VLNLLGFHTSQACANAKVRPPPTFPSIMGALESLVAGSIIALDAAGKVQFCSNLAQQYLESFFAKERPFHHGIPLTVKAWALQELTRFETDEFAVCPPRQFVARVAERTLHIRMANTREGDGCVLLLRSEDPAVELAKLSYFGLSARSTEVLCWLAKGKTNN